MSSLHPAIVTAPARDHAFRATESRHSFIRIAGPVRVEIGSVIALPYDLAVAMRCRRGRRECPTRELYRPALHQNDHGYFR
jgi:hypothetical protein